MDEILESERPSKRVKLDSEQDSTTLRNNQGVLNGANHDLPAISPRSEEKGTNDITAMEAQALKESEVGITVYISPDTESFTGILKKRYTDFLVNEILPNGEVCHLTNLKPPKVEQPEREDQSSNNRELSSTSHKSQPNQTTDAQQPSVNGQISDLNSSNEGTNQDPPIETTKEQPKSDISASAEAGSIPSTRNTTKGNEISPEDKALLISHLSESTVSHLLTLYAKILANPNIKPKEHGIISHTAFTSDRTIRGQIHQAIRRIFSSRIDSTTDSEGTLVLAAALPSHRQPRNQPGRSSHNHHGRSNKPSWADRGGQHLHFSLFKENKDTMEVLGFLARQLKTNMKSFQFAGTKDRRAVTVQRVSAYRIEAERLASVNRSLYGAQLGNYSYQTQGLELGDLHGNEFVITLRECSFPSMEPNLTMEEKLARAQTLITSSMHSLRENGFTNYFGLQRFGTFRTRTDTVGVALLQGNLAEACNLILSFDPAALSPETANAPIGQDDASRALALHQFATKSANLTSILNTLPRKFTAEAALVRHLTNHPTDHHGALQLIPRNLRTMYPHAYQSLVWNQAASHRWSLHGARVVAGDLVLVSEHKDKVLDDEIEGNAAAAIVDADGEIIVAPSSHDRSNTVDDAFERARALSAAEAASGLYSIFDIVLPLPGFDVLYPAHETGAFYVEFMGNAEGGGLDPHDMRRKQKDFSLSGSYRKLVARIGPEWEVQVKPYALDSDQFVETDLEKIRTREGGSSNGGRGGYRGLERKDEMLSSAGEEEKEEADKIAVVLKFQLGSSQYATMALRELMKGGAQAHKPEFGGRG